MAKSGQSFNKREKEKLKAKRKQEKQEKKEERKANSKSGQPLEDMMAYIDENGNLSTTPPDPSKKKTFNQEDIEIGVPKQSDLMDDDPIRTGIVSFYNTEKGFGFIKDSITGESVFFHESRLSEAIKENNKVQFETEMGAKGLVCINVKKI